MCAAFAYLEGKEVTTDGVTSPAGGHQPAGVAAKVGGKLVVSCLSGLLTVVASRIGLAVVAIILLALPSVFSPCRLRARNQESVFVR